jgi:hypothetical protein
MAKIKLTKTAVESAQPQAKDIELRDTVVPGFLARLPRRDAGCSCSSTARTLASPASPRWDSTGS